MVDKIADCNPILLMLNIKDVYNLQISCLFTSVFISLSNLF